MTSFIFSPPSRRNSSVSSASSPASNANGESELLRFCQQRQWEGARLRAESVPSEAKPSSSAYRGIGNTALAIAIRSGAPLDTVSAIFEADPDQLVKVRHIRRGTVLHEAIRYRADADVISYLLDQALHHEEARLAEGNTVASREEADDRSSAAPAGVAAPNLSDSVSAAAADAAERNAAAAASAPTRNQTLRMMFGIAASGGEADDRASAATASVASSAPNAADGVHAAAASAAGSASAVESAAAASADGNQRLRPSDYVIRMLGAPSSAATRAAQNQRSSMEETLANAMKHQTKADASVHILGQSDDMERTCLHHLIDRIARDILQNAPRSTTSSIANFRGTPRFAASRNGRETSKTLSEREIALMFEICRRMAQAYPKAVSMTDIDGHSPLMLALTVPPPGTFAGAEDGDIASRIDRGIEDMVHIFAEAAPETAELSISSPHIMGLQSAAVSSTLRNRGVRRITRRGDANVQQIVHEDSDEEMEDNAIESSDHSPKTADKVSPVNVGPNPLFFALKYRRSLATMETLLNANPSTGRSSPSCTAIVTSDLEVPLHVAVTMRAPTPVICLLLKYGPVAAAALDKYCLTPLDWLWMRHLLDRPFLQAQGEGSDSDDTTIAALPPFMPTKPTSRRYIPQNYLQLWNDAAAEIEYLNEAMNGNVKRRTFHAAFLNYRAGIGSLWEKASIMLPCAAQAIYEGCNDASVSSYIVATTQKWPYVHAAAYVQSPRPLLDLCLYYYPDQIHEKDALGRLPIHYAVSRFDRDLTYDLPPGLSSNITSYIRSKHPRSFSESSPVRCLAELYPEGCFIRDSDNRLPLHVALDMIKEYDEEPQQILGPGLFFPTDNVAARKSKCSYDAARSIIQWLIGANHAAFEQKDALTCLYPFMQAAVGSSADHDIIYMLLRDHPSLCMAFHSDPS